MKNLFTAIILGIALAGVSFAQSSKPRIAVLEFATGPNAAAMTAEAKRQLQSSIAFALVKKQDFEVPDVRNTRAATQGTDVGSAARLGKKMGVNYVLTGTVVEYSTSGRMTVKTQLVDASTGRVKHSGETSHQSAAPMTGNAGHAEMSVKVVKPLIQKLTASIMSAVL